MKYTHLTAEQQTALREQHAQRGRPAPVSDALRAAWEADHYAHSLQAAAKTGNEKAVHLKAMADIEKALAASTTR